ncbi:hypothetical protein A3C98_05035 [Candidatus Roizmanbacteria bacterium RIFCSPHIGHO2_02_FULL_37_15]|uniref:Uncharacterized protein n=1 Tax=Candidatus Roizmanbacteria bacterium RIFCSPLOWO2_01_FULL_37_16 TaxID=1802058 RepID=A0A1F7ILI4_9BACT|nr:MAG: hypothetical protein A3C98_05035 [Candidatus Roizmanbacteria bacterium RIFCSPHIGHO2_02_FULL_37_15]OGK44244.1 MAG: hypothetical protein A3B40_03700 [Candidatus Roizmanbacteria bacterium RIFCSPLOWO2_01_FULL_37_16]
MVKEELKNTQEAVRPQAFFGKLFQDLNAVSWEDSESGRDLDKVSLEIEGLAEEVELYYHNLTPKDILAEKDFWLGGMPEDLKREALNELQLMGGFGTYTLEDWNKAFMASGMIFINFGEVRERLDPLYGEPHFVLAYNLQQQGSSLCDPNHTIIPKLPLFEALRREWVRQFEQTDDPEHQAKYTHFLYKIKNNFLEHSEAIRIIVKKLFLEWDNAQFEGKMPALETDMIREKIERSLEELGLAAVSAKSAWAYVGGELPDQFIRYLMRIDDREKALRLFNDMIAMAKKNQYLYPPQLYYLFRYILPSYGYDGKSNLWQMLNNLYESGHNLLEFAEELNFIVTGDNRSEEYASFETGLLEGTDKEDIFFAPFSGPPVDILLKYLRWGWRGPLITVDKVNQEGLLERALALSNEFSADAVPYSPEELQLRIAGLVQDAKDGYPIDDNIWQNHLQSELPDEGLNNAIKNKGEVTLVLDQRGAILYLSRGRQLKQIYNNLSLLSKKPDSLIIFTKGVVDGLLVDLGLKRDESGKLRVKMIDRTDCYYPFNTVVGLFLAGAFTEGKVRADANDSKIYAFDKRRVGTGVSLVNQLINLIGDIKLTVGAPMYKRFEEELADLAEDIHRRHKWFKTINLQPIEMAILLQEILTMHGWFREERSLIALIKNIGGSSRLPDLKKLIKDEIEKRIAVYSANYKQPDFTELSFLAWAIDNKPEILIEVVKWLEKKLPSMLPNPRVLQTLRHTYQRFFEKYEFDYYDYILSGSDLKYRGPPT